MSKLDLITILAAVEVALKKPSTRKERLALANRLAAVRSGLIMTNIPDRVTDPTAVLAAVVDAAHRAGIDNVQLAAAFNAAVERHPR